MLTAPHIRSIIPSILFSLAFVPLLLFASWLVQSQRHDHDHGVHTTEIDIEMGSLTPEQLAQYEALKPNSALSSKTPPVALDGDHEEDILTIVIDFKEPGQAITTDVFGNEVGTFDVESFGFDASDFDLVCDAILAEVDEDFFDELAGTSANQNGQDLRIDFIKGDIGVAPPGVTEFYFVQVGTGLDGPQTFALGVASGRSVRDADGNGPNNGVEVGDVVASVFTDNIQGLSNLTPSDALSSGNLEFSRNAVVGTLSHEIGHVVSLSHINLAGSNQPTPKAAPIMGTGAIDLPSQLRITDREFSLSGFDAQNGNAPRFHIDQLVGAIGLHDIFSGPLPVESINFASGFQSAGVLANLNASDDQVLSALPSGPFVEGTAPLTFELTAITPIIDPLELRVQVESKANLLSVLQTIEVFDVEAGSYEVVDTRSLTENDQVVDLVLTSPSRFVNDSDGTIQTRLSYQTDGFVLFFPWRIDVDQAVIVVNP